MLIIVLDAARADAFSCYGYHRQTTPNLDRLASGGLRYTRAVSATSWTTPSHASLFTGLQPNEHGVHYQHIWLADHLDTLAELLRNTGYRTGAFSNNPRVSKSLNMHQGFEVFQEIWNYTEQVSPRQPDNSKFTNRLVRNFIQAAQAEKKPFFAFINYMDTHNPYAPPEPYFSKYLEPGDTISAKIDSANYNHKDVNYGILKLSEKEYRILRKLYDGSLSYVDGLIGQLLEFLRDRGLSENTLIVVTSDHGEIFGRWDHFTHCKYLYRPLIHIPLILSHPGLIVSPRVIDAPVAIGDIFHTVCSLLELKTDNKTGGPVRNLLSEQVPEQAAYSLLKVFPYENNRSIVKYKRDGHSLWTPGDKHYILFEGEQVECYDLARDFDETSNLYPGSVEREEIETEIGRFRERLNEFEESESDFVLRYDDALVSKEQAEALKTLGYVGDGNSNQARIFGGEEHPHVIEHFNRGYFLSRRDSLEEAEIELDIASRMSPRNIEIREELGMVQYLLGNYEEAVQTMMPLVGNTDQETAINIIMGIIFKRLNQYEKALERFGVAAQLHPERPDVAFKMIDLLLDIGREEQAGIVAGKLIKGTDNAGNALLAQLVTIFIEHGKQQVIRDIIVRQAGAEAIPHIHAVASVLSQICGDLESAEKFRQLSLKGKVKISAFEFDQLKSKLLQTTESYGKRSKWMTKDNF